MNVLKKFGSPKTKINNNNNHKCNIQGRIIHVRYMKFYYTERHFATLSFAKLLLLLTCRLKHCSNGGDKEKDEISMSGSRNDLQQSCWDRVTNRQWHAKPFKSIKLATLVCKEDQVNNKGRTITKWFEPRSNIPWCVITSPIYQRLLYLLTNQIAHQGFWIFNWLTLPLDSEDGFRTGCRNVSH